MGTPSGYKWAAMTPPLQREGEAVGEKGEAVGEKEEEGEEEEEEEEEGHLRCVRGAAEQCAARPNSLCSPDCLSTPTIFKRNLLLQCGPAYFC